MDLPYLNYSSEVIDNFYDVPIVIDDNVTQKASSYNIILIVLNVLTFLLGIPLNTAVIVGICKKSYEKSAWDIIFLWYCLQNISVIITENINTSVDLLYWIPPNWMCPIVLFTGRFFHGSTAITLSCLAFVCTVFFKDFGKRCLPVEICLILSSIMIAAIVSIPSAIYIETKLMGYTVCISNPAPAYLMAYYVIFFFCPMLAIIGMTILFSVLNRAWGNNCTRVLVVRVLITVIYIVCWSPQWILSFLLYVDPQYGGYGTTVLWGVFSWLITLGCCISALVVLVLDTSVRQALCRKRLSGNVDEARMELTKH